MINITENHMKDLQVLVEGGAQVFTVSYNPAAQVGDPEGEALAKGYTVFYREDFANRVEIIYTKS